MSVLVYHHGECSKCKELTDILNSKEVMVNYKFYLQEDLSVDELRGLLLKLNLKAADIIRKSEPLYTEQYEGKEMSDDEWLQIIVDNPILLQRPIVVNGNNAIIARPPQKVLEIL